jgi:hypothetical protein
MNANDDNDDAAGAGVAEERTTTGCESGVESVVSMRCASIDGTVSPVAVAAATNSNYIKNTSFDNHSCCSSKSTNMIDCTNDSGSNKLEMLFLGAKSAVIPPSFVTLDVSKRCDSRISIYQIQQKMGE